MEVLFFLLFIANINLSRGDDNVAMESDMSYQETYKVYPDTEDVEDQVHGKAVGENLNEIQDGRQNQFQINVQKLKYSDDGHMQYPHDDHQQIHQQIVLPNDSGHKTILLNGIQGVHHGSHLVYTHPQQQSYQMHPQIEILGAAHLQRINEDHGHQKASGYSSYVEHVSKKEDEEIKSALQEGSVDDLKRLVPKSGISFKIYHNNNNEHANGQNIDTQTNYLVLNDQGGKQEDNLHNSRLRHKLRVEVPAAPIQIQTFHHDLHQPHQLYVKHEEHLGNSHQSVQVIDAHPQGSQDVGVKDTYYTQIQGSSPEPPVNGEQHYKLQAEVSDKPTSTSEFTQNSVTGGKIIRSKEGIRKEITKFQYKKPLNYPSGFVKPELSQKKTIKHMSVEVKPVEVSHTVHHDSSNSYMEGTKGGLTSYVSHSTSSPVETGKTGALLSHSTATQHAEAYKSGHNGFLSHSTAAPYVGMEAGKSVHGGLITHTTAAPHVEAYKSGHNGFVSHSTVAPFVNLEAGKSGGHGVLLSHTTAAPHVEGFKSGHNGFLSHSTAAPYVSFEAGKNVHGGLITHTTGSPHLEGFKSSYNSFTSHVGTYEKGGHGGLVTHTTVAPHVQFGKPNQGGEFLSHASVEIPKTGAKSFVSHTTANPYVGIESSKSGNLVGHSFEAGKTGQSHFVKVLDTQPYVDTEILKTHVPNSSGNVEYGHKLTAHQVQNTYIDAEGTKAGQNNFDHQKALEGSTSFDIKNAIGNAEAHHLEGPTKQPLSYFLPHIPVSLIGNHETSLVQGHQNFGTHEFLYPSVSLPIGKYYRQPHVVWTSEHFKHGNAPTANDLHQPLIRLHLPKEELHHGSHPKPGPHHPELPFFKYAQDVHFQPNKHPRGNNFKLLPMSVPEWDFYKTKMPNLNLNTVLVKPDLMAYSQDSGKQIIPILVKKRNNRSNKDVGVIYGKVNEGRRPVKPNQRQEKNVRGSLQPEASNQIKSFGNRKNEFSVSASYKVDRSLRNVDGS